jgi:hypothetical protein
MGDKIKITQDKFDNVVTKLISSSGKVMPNPDVFKIVNLYLNHNPNVNVSDLVAIKLKTLKKQVINGNTYYSVRTEDYPERTVLVYDPKDNELHMSLYLIYEILAIIPVTDIKLEAIIMTWVQNDLDLKKPIKYKNFRA